MMGIFEPYRALGYITDGSPFCVQRRGAETFVTVSVGKAFQIFDCAKLTLVFVGPQLEKKIRGLACWRDFTYAASGCEIFVFRRAQQVSIWSGHESKVSHVLSFGNHILSIGLDGWLFVWDAASMQGSVPTKKLHLGQLFLPTCIMHPDTYLNKVVIGSEEGSLQLWNVNTQKMLYSFKGWGSAVYCCVSSPVLDVVGIGCADGKVYIHNIRYDETVVTFSHTTRGAVTALSFRRDGRPLLAAGGSSGVISLWNLERKKLQAIIKDAHDSPICSLYFFPNEPVLLSSAKDNSLKMWIFDSNDGEPRLLRFRSGHSAPPTCMRYYGNGRHILSAGQDRAFRLFSTIQDQQSRELSQRHVARRAKKLKIKEEELKLPPVLAFAAAEIRERDWCNVVTCHMNDNAAYSWRLQNFVIGEHRLKPVADDPSPVKSCAISACGNYAVLGTESGHVERFNLQSGLNRGMYHDLNLEGSQAHTGSVIGLACDATNTLLISGGYDSYIKIWDFKSRDLKSNWCVGSPLVKIEFHRGNGLVAVVSDDLVLRLYDIVATRLVRLFQGHTDRVTDMCFSEDGKWLLSSAMDGTVRVWDVIVAKQLDAMHVDVAVSSLSLSPSMDMLATTHVGYNGIYLWANRFMYSGMTDTEGYGSGNDVVKTLMPTVSLPRKGPEDEDSSLLSVEVANKKNCGSISLQDVGKAEFQISTDLVTLSMLPKAQWQSLINLDAIKIRNKPIAPPKKPEKAPFFLPTVSSVSGNPLFISIGSREDGGDKMGTEKKQPVSRLKNKSGHVGFESVFLQLLSSSLNSGDFSPFLSFLKGLTPSEIDLEFRMLEILDEEDIVNGTRSKELQDISMVLDFLIRGMVSNKDFEFLQALVQLFLKIHGAVILQHPQLQEQARVLLDKQRNTWQRLDSMFQNVRCMLSFFSNSVY